MRVACPNCGTRINLRDGTTARTVRCPECGESVAVPVGTRKAGGARLKSSTTSAAPALNWRVATAGGAGCVVLIGALVWWMAQRPAGGPDAGNQAAQKESGKPAAGASLDETIQLAVSGPLAQRRTAARALRTAGFEQSADAIRALGGLLGDADPELKTVASEALTAAIRDPQQNLVRQALLSMLSVAQPPAVDAALQELIVQEKEAFLPLLIARLRAVVGTADAGVYTLIALLPRIAPASPEVADVLVNELNEVSTRTIGPAPDRPIGAIASIQEVTNRNDTHLEAVVTALSKLDVSLIPRLLEFYPGPERGVEAALLRMGAAAVPALIADLQSGNARGLPLFAAFGPQAEPAVPTLVAMLDDPRYGGQLGEICHVLGAIGPAAQPAEDRIAALLAKISSTGGVHPSLAESLCRLRGKRASEGVSVLRFALTSHTRSGNQILYSQPPEVRVAAARTLGDIGAISDAANDDLLGCARDESVPAVRIACACALIQKQSPHSAEAFDHLGKVVQSITAFEEDRLEAIRRLEHFGAAARSQSPALVAVLGSPFLGAAAAKALKSVDPQAAAERGIK